MNTHTSPWTRAALGAALTLIVACGGDTPITNPGEQPPPAVRLKEIVIDRLPSPYYHFDYDTTGRIAAASYSGGFGTYRVDYAGDRIDRMINSGAAALAHIAYIYDDAGRVGGVKYVDRNGVTFTTVFYTYENGRLTNIERSQRVTAGGMIIDKTMDLAYYPDGNLETITEHRLPIEGVQSDATSITRFEDYDSGINVDGFSLIHDDFFDHLVLLPGDVLQKNNPRRETQTGNGLNYTIAYTYAYDTDGKRPLTKSGELEITSGDKVGQHFATSSVFSYY
jgi:hypothetical protein